MAGTANGRCSRSVATPADLDALEERLDRGRGISAHLMRPASRVGGPGAQERRARLLGRCRCGSRAASPSSPR
ncbi:MAG: hypothetical protein ACLTSX_02940 [Collinsella sp.]